MLVVKIVLLSCWGTNYLKKISFYMTPSRQARPTWLAISVCGRRKYYLSVNGGAICFYDWYCMFTPPFEYDAKDWVSNRCCHSRDALNLNVSCIITSINNSRLWLYAYFRWLFKFCCVSFWNYSAYFHALRNNMSQYCNGISLYTHNCCRHESCRWQKLYVTNCNIAICFRRNMT